MSFNHLFDIEKRLASEWNKMEVVEDQLQHYRVEKAYLSDLLLKCNRVIRCLENDMAQIQDEYNECALEHDAYVKSDGGTLRINDDDDASDYDIYDSPYDDIEVKPRERFTRTDILSPIQAIKSKKSSKLHKLKPKCPNKDKTKMKEAKVQTMRVKTSKTAHMDAAVY